MGGVDEGARCTCYDDGSLNAMGMYDIWDGGRKEPAQRMPRPWDEVRRGASGKTLDDMDLYPRCSCPSGEGALTSDNQSSVRPGQFCQEIPHVALSSAPASVRNDMKHSHDG